MEWIATADGWASLLTLTALEIVLGIDNIVFLAVVASRLPESQRPRARQLGLIAALVMRIALLAAISWIIGLTAPLFVAFGMEFSWRDLILIAGGVFLLAKGTWEIHHAVEGEHESHGRSGAKGATFFGVVAQIMVLDLVFSIDSVITAVGMADDIGIMVTAVVIAIIVMLVAANPVGKFIERHPTTKMLALSFLLLVGMALVADGFEVHIPRGFLYFAIAFSAGVEVLNLAAKTRRERRRATAG
ncbi:MAG: TerC family protein [Alphaproteobacteria bacterium]|nr:TerC family protein [Alphaproteobacteria bacterium]